MPILPTYIGIPPCPLPREIAPYLNAVWDVFEQGDKALARYLKQLSSIETAMLGGEMLAALIVIPMGADARRESIEALLSHFRK